MTKVYYLAAIVIFAVLGIIDIKRKSIDVRLLIIAAVMIAAGGLFTLEKTLPDRALGLIPGLTMLLCGKITRGGVGTADIVLVLAIGVGTGFFEGAGIVSTSLILCGIFALVVICFSFKKGNVRKKTLPFIPFLFLGVIINNIGRLIT